ncbi:hypothetical protein B0H10DRAFT_2236747 [Mycena sp. CBHHK59/15]|nr:hypothetical protein B0H10DRAFT_2236747 [Mycena sp. CBHHK59/15]
MTLDSLCECGMRAAFGSFRTSQSGRSIRVPKMAPLYDASITIVTAAAAVVARLPAASPPLPPSPHVNNGRNPLKLWV